MICVAAVFLLQAQTGRIQVSAIDLTSAPVHAKIQVLHRDSGETVASGQASQDRGVYLSPPLAAGRYNLTIRMAGFSTRHIENVEVQAGKITDLGTVTLRVPGCDAPGVICDGIGPVTTYVHWDERLRAGCAVDIDQSNRKKCATAKTADLRLEIQGQQVYLVVSNGARLSPVNPDVDTCQTANYTEERMRVDNLGSGFDVCLKSDRGKLYKIYFIDRLANEANLIPVRFVKQL